MMFASPLARLVRGAPRLAASRRLLSTQPILVLGSSRLAIDCSAVPAIRIELTSQWQDHCSWKVSAGLKVTHNVNEQTRDILLELCPTDSAEQPTLTVLLPEMLNVDIVAQDLRLLQQNKLMGDLFVQCKNGTLDLNKVRGHRIELDVGQAAVKVRKVLEGSAAISCGAFWAKMLNGERLQLHSQATCHIEAGYVRDAFVATADTLKVDLFKGVLTARSQRGDVQVHKLDGGFDVRADVGSVDLQVNAVVTECRAAAGADLVCLVNPEVVCALDCTSDISEVRIEAAAFREDGGDGSKRRSGALTGPQTPVPMLGTRARSGKIDLTGAAASALRGIAASEDAQPLALRLSAGGALTVQALSWMDVIRRKHGMA